MNDIEHLLKMLPLQAPSTALDERVLSLLESPTIAMSANGHESRDGELQDRESTVRAGGSVRRATKRPVSRGGIASVVAPVAGVCLLLGMMAGRIMPDRDSIPRSDANSSRAENVTSQSARELSSGVFVSAERANVERSDLASLHDRNSTRPVAHAQPSTARLAALWEQRTGQRFDVASHVSDRRFDACRQCHLAGG